MMPKNHLVTTNKRNLSHQSCKLKINRSINLQGRLLNWSCIFLKHHCTKETLQALHTTVEEDQMEYCVCPIININKWSQYLSAGKKDAVVWTMSSPCHPPSHTFVIIFNHPCWRYIKLKKKFLSTDASPASTQTPFIYCLWTQKTRHRSNITRSCVTLRYRDPYMGMMEKYTFNSLIMSFH